MSTDNMRYGFGKNWENYIKEHFSEERVEISKNQLLAFLKLETLEGKYFLDIGCGSGLQSLAALRAGAARIVSFDYDPNSVSTAKMLREFAGNPERWQVLQGSILDGEFLKSIEPADIVHSWGVLHHTGNMWQAMDNTTGLAKKGALLYIALYDYDIQVNPTPEFWLDVKQRYNQSDERGKRRMERWYIWRFILNRNIGLLPGFVKRVINYKRTRGMDMFTDIRDWLGGWPMEFAKRADVKAWAEKQNLEMLTMKTGEANTEYLFKK
jgi:SAM-dependent methyltransferase